MKWMTKPLVEVLSQIRTGSTPSTLRPELFNGSIAWFTPSDIGSAKDLVRSSRYVSEEAIRNGRAKLFPQGSLLVTCIGDIGRVGILNQPASSNQQITSLLFTSEVDVDYAYYWFIANQWKLEQRANQAIVPILNNERLQEVEFFYPLSNEEQKGIAAVLGQADRLRRRRRYALELSDTLLQSVFVKMFGDFNNEMRWKVEELGAKISFLTSGSRGWAQHYSNKGDLFLRIQNVGHNRLLLDEIAYVEAPDTVEAKRTKVESGDVLITITADLGRSAVIPEGFPTAYINQHLVLLRLKELNPTFVSAFISSRSGQSQIERLDREGVKSGLNFDDIRSLQIFTPPIPLQEKFANFVRHFERLRKQQHEATRQTEHLFQTLLHRAFRGEFTA